MSDDRSTDEPIYSQASVIRAAGALAAGIAHDFNNILAGILSQLDLALYAEELPVSLREYLVFAQTSARRGAELAGRLTAFSRASEPELKPINLIKIMDELAARFPLALGPGTAIRCAPSPPEAGQVLADERLITQVLIYLCLHAREVLAPGREIWLAVSDGAFAEATGKAVGPAGGYVRLSVGDRSDGMSTETRHPLFEPFFTTPSPGAGTGLGLAISYHIVRAHNGWMEVDRPPGKGHWIHAYLPRAIPPISPPAIAPIPAETHAAADTEVPLSRETVLVADDEELVRLVVRTVLAYRGYHVLEASSGEQALEIFRQSCRRIDIVVLDVHMTRLNGWDTLAQLRQHQPGLAAILLSGAPSDTELEKARQVGNVQFLSKPFENHDLARLVRKTLDAALPHPSAPSPGLP